MAEDRRFIIEIRSKGFQKAKRNLVQVKQDADKLAASTKVAAAQTRSHVAAMNNASGAGATFRREMSALRNNMLLYTFAIGGAVVAVGNLVSAFADAQDTTNRFRSVFKELAPEAEAFATSFGEKFGFARTEVMKMMETFQGLFVPLGFSREAAAGLSEAMVKLSMDVGSFRDVDPTQVAQMFTSALIGNHEAVRRLKIQITETSVKNAALAHGFALTKDTVSEQAKVLGRFTELLRQSEDAIGDSVRTYDDYNNRVRRLNQQFYELRQNVGEALLPTAELGVKLAEDALQTNVLRNTLGTLIFTTGVYRAATAGAAAATAYLASGTVGLRAALGALIPGAGTVIAIFTVLAGGLTILSNKLKEAQEQTKKMAQEEQDLQALVKKLNEDLNIKAQHLKMVALRSKELREAVAKRNTALAVEVMLVGETSRMAKEMIKARLEENRALTDTELKLIAMIEQRKVDAEAAKEEAQAIKDSADALKSRLEDLQVEATTMDTNSALIKATVEARIRENRELTTGEINLLRHIDSLRIEQDAMQASVSAIHSRSDAIRTLGEDLHEISIKNQAFMISQITGSKELGQLDELRTRTLQKMFKAADDFRSLIKSGIYDEFIVDLEKELSSLDMAELLTKDFEAFLTTWSDENGVKSTEKLVRALQVLQVEAGETALAAIETSKSFDKTAQDSQRMATSILSAANAVAALTGEFKTSQDAARAFLSVAGLLVGVSNPALGAALQVGSMLFGHTGGLVKNNGIQRFAQGGTVRGQDNVPIMAQAGEFVMRRDAVRNIGVQNLAEMNRSGSSGGVTVNIQGNMIGNESFVRDTLIPEITRAQRMNLA
jgi:hypothetical protein